MQFHPTQSQVAKDKHPYRVVDCGRQWGKTTLAVWEMIACAYAGGGRKVSYFATTFDQARDIAWQLLKDETRAIWAKQPNETLLELSVHTQDKGISDIKLRGFEAVERVRGGQNDLAVLDEVGKMRNFKAGWEGAIEPTLAFRNGRALFISTPQGYNHFYDLWEKGQTDNPVFKSWQFTSYDNPFLSRESIQRAKDNSTPDYFAQEYLAEFTRFTGLIYKEFDLQQDVNYFDHEFDQYGDYYFGLDFATRGWTAALASWHRPDGHTYHLDNYKVEGITAKEHAAAIKKMLLTYAPLEKWTGYADPAGFAKNQQGIKSGQFKEMLWSVADEYLEEGLPIVAANNKVTAGINFVRNLHKDRRIHIHPRCQSYIDEKIQYQWKDQPPKQVGIKNEPEEPRKINDHLMDAERYVLYSKPTAPDEEVKPTGLVFPAEFGPPKIDTEEREDEDKITPIDIPSVFD